MVSWIELQNRRELADRALVGAADLLPDLLSLLFGCVLELLFQLPCPVAMGEPVVVVLHDF